MRRLLVMGFAVLGTAAVMAAPQANNKLTLTGKLQTGVMAVGGETTGITLTAGNVAYELDIKDAALKKKADELNGKNATVKGTLTLKQGVESKQRRIIVVESLEAAAETK